jgi:hypothetical protein
MVTKDRSTWPGWARALSTGWVLSPIIVIALLAATFEGYGYYTRHQKTTYSRGGAFGGVDPVNVANTTKSKGGRVASSKVASSKKAPAGPHIVDGGKQVSMLTTGSSSGGGHTIKPVVGGGSHTGGTSSPVSIHNPTTSHHPTQSSSPTPSPTATALNPPTVGIYSLAVSGSETAKFGPISACHNEFPSRATLDIHHATGESPASYDFDMRMYPNSPNRHDERHIYKYGNNSMSLGYEQETVTCTGIKQSTSVSYSPAQIRVAGPLKVGSSWHNHGGGSSRVETGNSTVARKGLIKVEGNDYVVYEIVTKLAMTGSETGERDQSWWYSPDLGIPLKFTETLHGKRSGASYSESYSASVISLP